MYRIQTQHQIPEIVGFNEWVATIEKFATRQEAKDCMQWMKKQSPSTLFRVVDHKGLMIR